MAEKNSDMERKIREVQILEQNIQNLLFQKQAFQMEISETSAALKEIENSKEVFKIIGQLMIKSDSGKIRDELSSKEKLLSLRIKSIEKQESEIIEHLDSLKKEIL